ncbi:hypothetical protein RIF29_24508 [Crotalaria pallida]|uniref:Uncharacterized protein n=1 Tax=Crotalaria pallida TaxID=3830 RepID=A0AAN9EJV0_CROPI
MADVISAVEAFCKGTGKSSVAISVVICEANMAADYFAKTSSDVPQRFQLWEVPPSGVSAILQQDLGEVYLFWENFCCFSNDQKKELNWYLFRQSSSQANGHRNPHINI